MIEKRSHVSTRSHLGSLLFSQSKHSNYRRCQSLSDVASVINPTHWTQDIRHEHTCKGVSLNPPLSIPPAPRPAVHSASSTGIESGIHFVLPAAVSPGISQATSVHFNPHNPNRCPPLCKKMIQNLTCLILKQR